LAHLKVGKKGLTMKQNTAEIRQNILKGEGMGFTKTEIVKSVAEKVGCSTSDVYWHLSTRDKWQNEYLDYGDKKGLFNMTVRYSK
jgi:hypothetical protein